MEGSNGFYLHYLTKSRYLEIILMRRVKQTLIFILFHVVEGEG